MNTLYAHPNNIEELNKRLELVHARDNNTLNDLGLSPIGHMMAGLALMPCEYLPEWTETGKVLFPNDPYVEYENSDEGWALALGLATKEVERGYYMMENGKPTPWQVSVPNNDPWEDYAPSYLNSRGAY